MANELIEQIDKALVHGFHPTDVRVAELLRKIRDELERLQRDGDVNRYDESTVRHVKEREHEYRRTLWAAAACQWPNPLRIPRVARDTYMRSSELQTREDPATLELLVFAPPHTR